MVHQKVKAFTILEVTITMLITALLIGITYTSYSIIVKSYHSFTAKNEEMAVLVTLDHLLKRDFGQAESIFKDQDGIVLTSNDKTIKYEFKPDYMVRTAARIDTFKVQTEGLNTTFESIPVNETQETEEENRIDEVAFILVYKNEKIPYHYHKSYSSVNLIQRNPYAIN
jgi:Tfp pilus assembly protein PilE